MSVRPVWLWPTLMMALGILLGVIPAHAAPPTPAPGPATLFADLNPGVAGSSLAEPVALGEQVVFMGNDNWQNGCIYQGGTWGCEPWVSNGTPAGTRMLADIDPGGFSPVFNEYKDESSYQNANPVRIGRHVLFHFVATPESWNEEIWSTDGTPAGTRRLISSLSEQNCPNSDYCQLAMTPVSDRFTLVSIVGSGSGYYYTLWLTNGTPGSTVHAASFNEFGHILVLGERAFFFADDGHHGQELWISDGRVAGTHILLELRPGQEGVNVLAAQLVGAEIWFMVEAGAEGTELWASDGSADGTRLITTIPLDPNGLRPIDMTPAGERLFFVINNTLWVSDGSAAGTTPLLSVTAPEECWLNEEQTLTCWRPIDLHRIGESFLFSVPRFVPHGTDPPTYDLIMDSWTSDGTPAGTRPAPWTTPTGEYYDTYLTSVGGRYIIRRQFQNNGNFQYEHLLSLDPTDWSAIILAEIGQPRSLTMHNGEIFFSGNDPEHGSELWVSDGTPAGTRMIQDINPGSTGSEPGAYAMGSQTLFFTADDGVHGNELWRLPLLALEPFPASSVLDHFTRRDGPLGARWIGPNLSSYRLANGQANVQANGVIYWPQRFGADQEAYVTLAQMDPDGIHSLLLKVESHNNIVAWRYGAIRVSYDASLQKLQAETFQPGKGWQSLAAWPATLGNGSILGARVLHNGVVQVYVDSTLVGSVDTSVSNPDFFHDNDRGRIGLWMHDANNTRLDEFGGGSIP